MKDGIVGQSFQIAQQEVVVLRAVKSGAEIADLLKPAAAIDGEMVDVVDACRKNGKS